MNVLFVAPSYWPFISGAQTFLQAMAERLVSDDHRVTILTTMATCAEDFWRDPETPPILSSREILGGVRIERCRLTYPKPAPFVFSVLRRVGLALHHLRIPVVCAAPVQRYLARWMPPLEGFNTSLEHWVPQSDLIHVVDGSWDGLLLSAASVAARYSKPLVVSPLMHLGGRTISAHYQMAHQVQVYRGADAVIALSGYERTAYQSLGVDSNKLHVLRMGVDPLSDVELIQKTRVLRRDSTLSEVLFLGVNTYDKGAFTLAQAVVKLNQEGFLVNLVVAGPRPEDLKRYLRQRPHHEQAIARDHIRVLGFVDSTTKHQLLETTALLALPSRVDTFGIVFLEAWQYHKPVIGALAGGIPEVITHGVDGLLVPFGDVTSLAAAIRELLQNQSLAHALGGAGHAKAQTYTWESTYGELLQIYDNVRMSCV